MLHFLEGRLKCLQETLKDMVKAGLPGAALAHRVIG